MYELIVKDKTGKVIIRQEYQHYEYIWIDAEHYSDCGYDVTIVKQ